MVGEYMKSSPMQTTKRSKQDTKTLSLRTILGTDSFLAPGRRLPTIGLTSAPRYARVASAPKSGVSFEVPQASVPGLQRSMHGVSGYLLSTFAARFTAIAELGKYLLGRSPFRLAAPDLCNPSRYLLVPGSTRRFLSLLPGQLFLSQLI